MTKHQTDGSKSADTAATLRDIRVTLIALSVALFGFVGLLVVGWRELGAQRESIRRLAAVTEERLTHIERFIKFTTDGVWVGIDDITGPSRGARSAAVTVVEFGDFQCPACQSLAPVLAALVDDQPDEVRLIFKHAPIEILHEHARAAALGGLCAEAAGRFWAYHDTVYGRQDELAASGVSLILEVGEAVGLDPGEFAACMESEAAAAQLETDLAIAQRLTVRATPTLFVNGRRIEGAAGDMVEDAIGFELRKRSRQVSGSRP